MKNTIVIFVTAAIVLAGVILFALNTDLSGNIQEILMIGGVVILVGFSIILGIGRTKSLIRKETPEDELSKKIMAKAASLSYYISLYFWLVMMYLSDKTAMELNSFIGAGIMGMAIIFLLAWIGVRLKGIKNE